MFVFLNMATGFHWTMEMRGNADAPTSNRWCLLQKIHSAPTLENLKQVMKNTCLMFCMQIFHNIFRKWNWNRIGFVSQKWLYRWTKIVLKQFPEERWNGTHEHVKHHWTILTFCCKNFAKRKAIWYSSSRPLFFTHCAFNHKLDQIWLFFPKIVCSLYCKFSAPLRCTWVGFVGVHS